MAPRRRVLGAFPPCTHPARTGEHMNHVWRPLSGVVLATLCLAAMPAQSLHAQDGQGPPDPVVPGQQRSTNMKLMSHVPLGAALSVADIEIEQELSRPYAYIARGVV